MLTLSHVVTRYTARSHHHVRLEYVSAQTLRRYARRAPEWAATARPAHLTAVAWLNSQRGFLEVRALQPELLVAELPGYDHEDLAELFVALIVSRLGEDVLRTAHQPTITFGWLVRSGAAWLPATRVAAIQQAAHPCPFVLRASGESLPARSHGRVA